MKIDAMTADTMMPEPRKKRRVLRYVGLGLLGLLGLILAVGLIAQLMFTFSGSGEWELYAERDGVTVYSMKTPGSNLMKYKGFVQVESNLDEIVTFMLTETGEDDGFYAPRELRREGETRFWTNWRTVFPEPFKPRDFVVKHEFLQDPETQAVTYQLTATPDLIPEDDCCVRVPKMDNHWIITPIDADTLEIEWLVDMNLGGFAPYFIVNQIHPNFMIGFASKLQERLDDERYDDADIDWIDDVSKL